MPTACQLPAGGHPLTFCASLYRRPNPAPRSCTPGSVGDSAEALSQSGPGCARVCPERHYCPSATVVPITCPAANYCPIGSTEGTPCREGTFTNTMGLRSQSECQPCPAGSWCFDGVKNDCPANTCACAPGMAPPHAYACRVPLRTHSRSSHLAYLRHSAAAHLPTWLPLLPLTCPYAPRRSYNDKADQSNSTACILCPDNSQTAATGAVSVRQCICRAGYYFHPLEQACSTCPTGSACGTLVGLTLATLPVAAGYFRTSNASTEPHRCPGASASSGCIGGNLTVGELFGPCADWLDGPLCRLCNVTDNTRYFDSSGEKETCSLCEGQADIIFFWVGGILILVVLVLAVGYVLSRTKNARLQALRDRLLRFVQHVEVGPKVKVFVTFVQISVSIKEVSMPQLYRIPLREGPFVETG